MAIVRWIPKRSVFDLANEFDRFWEDFLPMQASGRDRMWNPRVDMKDKKDEFVVTAELPGLTEKDIKITLKENQLVISGEKKVEEETDNETYHCCERSYGKFERAILLPTEIDANKTEARVKDGVLMIKLPKAEKVKPKEITISAK